MTTKRKERIAEFWEQFKPPDTHIFLTDDEVINCLKYVRDRTISLLVEKFLDERPTMAKSAGMLECIDRCHRQIELADSVRGIGDSKGEGSSRDITIGYEKSLPSSFPAQDRDPIDA
jgi:hypothetical protein